MICRTLFALAVLSVVLPCFAQNLSGHFPSAAQLSRWGDAVNPDPIVVYFNGRQIELKWKAYYGQSGSLGCRDPWNGQVEPRFAHTAVVFYRPDGKTPWFYHYKIWEYMIGPPLPDGLCGSLVKLRVMSTMFERRWLGAASGSCQIL